MIVGCGVYAAGKRTGTPARIEGLREASRERGGFASVELESPAPAELRSLAAEFGLPPLAVERASRPGQRPRTERYGGLLFTVLRPVRYLDAEERVEFGELHVLCGEDFVVLIGHGGTPSAGDEELTDGSGEPAVGPLSVLCAVADRVVEGYALALDGLENDVDEIETEVFGEGAQEGSVRSGAAGEVSRRIYRLSREVILLHRMTRSTVESFEAAPLWEADSHTSPRLRDVHDRAVRIKDRTEGLRDIISNIINLNLAIVGAAQTDQNKRISAWAAILIVPTVIAGIYGMNFRFMPELEWRFGYPFVLLLMLTVSAGLYLSFKRRDWL